MKRSKETARYLNTTWHLVEGRTVTKAELVTVRVMARAEGYAMVRRPGAMPFVVPERDLNPESGAPEVTRPRRKLATAGTAVIASVRGDQKPAGGVKRHE